MKAARKAQEHHKQWKKEIGADSLPDSLEKYYDIKYNNPKEMNLLRDIHMRLRVLKYLRLLDTITIKKLQKT